MNNNKITHIISLKQNSVISIVGGGGKTSILFRLAQEFSEDGFPTLLTTTTNMLHPEKEDRKFSKIIIGHIDKNVLGSPEKGSIYVAAKSVKSETGKLKGHEPEDIDNIHHQSIFDYIIVEADGARKLPIRAPASHEPVIPTSTYLAAGVIGLDSLNKPLNLGYVHGPELFSGIINASINDLITENHIYKLVHSEKDLFKNISPDCRKIVILKKADTHDLIQLGIDSTKKILFQKNVRIPLKWYSSVQ